MVRSPCVGVCSTTLGDEYCRGCQRSHTQITRWSAMNDAQRDACMQAIDQLREQVAQRFMHVFDAALLERKLLRHGIRYRPEQPPLSRVIELLRVGRGRIQQLDRYGVECQPSTADLDIKALYAALNQALLMAVEQSLDSPC